MLRGKHWASASRSSTRAWRMLEEEGVPIGAIAPMMEALELYAIGSALHEAGAGTTDPDPKRAPHLARAEAERALTRTRSRAGVRADRGRHGEGGQGEGDRYRLAQRPHDGARRVRPDHRLLGGCAAQPLARANQAGALRWRLRSCPVFGPPPASGTAARSREIVALVRSHPRRPGAPVRPTQQTVVLAR